MQDGLSAAAIVEPLMPMGMHPLAQARTAMQHNDPTHFVIDRSALDM
jgi:hypothetical protein